jgi:hypothetical protein
MQLFLSATAVVGPLIQLLSDRLNNNSNTIWYLALVHLLIDDFIKYVPATSGVSQARGGG